MSLPTLFNNEYERRARLQPALLVSLPLTLALMSCFPDLSGMQFLAGGATYCGFTALLSQLGRDQGKKKEPRLFEMWGGIPTTLLLRHRNNHLDVSTKKRYHDALNSLIPDMRLPNVIEEQSAPDEADVKYDSCVSFLREKTRDTKKFSLIFAENVNYGFRRNLWGMKPAGILLCFLSIILATGALVANTRSESPLAVASVAIIVNGLMLAWWLLRITPEWIRIPAYSYAERLLAASETLQENNSKSAPQIITH